MEEAVKGKTSDELKTEENLLKLTALKTTSNISVLIRDLFHSPPSFKHELQLSWVTRKPVRYLLNYSIKKLTNGIFRENLVQNVMLP